MEAYFETREEWRDWLERNSKSLKEVWLVYFKKGSGKPSVRYEEAVEEALCYGWIDGMVKSIDGDSYMQRFTPRRRGSKWSDYNVKRVEKLIKEGLMKPEGLELFKEAKENKVYVYGNVKKELPPVPDDFLKALSENQLALRNFNSFPPHARRSYIEWILCAKKPETREKRINTVIERSEKKLKPGMM
jgi:uncharacterized protein YdeI (YjbR/CyaY-like superfamily)